MLPGSEGREKTMQGASLKKPGIPWKRWAGSPEEEVRGRPVEKAGWSDHRPVGPHPNKFHLNQLHVEPLSHLSQRILWIRRQ